MCKKSWQNLAQAIIKRAMKDVRNNRHRKDAELFLESEWCDNLRFFANLELGGSDVITYKINYLKGE